MYVRISIQIQDTSNQPPLELLEQYSFQYRVIHTMWFILLYTLIFILTQILSHKVLLMVFWHWAPLSLTSNPANMA